MSIEILVAIGSAILTSVIGPVTVKVFENWLSKNKKKNDPLQEAIGINTLITVKLEEIKEEYRVDRVWLAQFHNGGHFYPTGKSMQKFSMVYELTKSNSIQTQFQNIPISLFSKSINKLSEGEIIKIHNFETDESYGLESFAEATGIKSEYIFPIRTINNRFIGIAGLDYVKETRLSDSQVYDIELEISSIGGVIMNEYLTKK